MTPRVLAWVAGYVAAVLLANWITSAYGLVPAGFGLIVTAGSRRRFSYAEHLGCRSADGTFLAFAPDANLPRLLSWTWQGALFSDFEDATT